MIKKKLTVVTYHSYSEEIYNKILEPLFSKYVDIKNYTIDDGNVDKKIDADLILLSTFTLFQKVKELNSNNAEIIIADHTLRKEGTDRIKKLASGTKAILVNVNYRVCIESIFLIHQLGYRNLELVPVYPGSGPIADMDLAITPGESRLVPDNVGSIIDIGDRVFSISTIADIAYKLGLQEIIYSDKFNKYSNSIVPSSNDLEKALGENQILNKQLDVLLSVMDKGIIIINSSGLIHSYNASTERIIGYRKEKMIGENALKLLPEIPYAEVLESGKEIKQKLIRINEGNMVVTVSPIINAGILSGAVAMIDKFTEIEKKQHELRVQLIGKGHRAKYTFEDILGESPPIINCKKIAKRMASSNSSILIMGESGTGKELFAQAIHNESGRNDYQFVAINCAALPESLLESELFGYASGAFTGAKKEGKMGLFELAHKGTLFLDEIGEVSPTLQARLLRVLQERSFMQIGGEEVINVDVRIIAATNSDLKELMNTKRFRQDLYYRLNVLPLNIPALRDRKEDIPTLVNEYKRKLNADFILSKEAEDELFSHEWQGNIRELINCVEYLNNIEEELIFAQHLPLTSITSMDDTHTEGKANLVDKLLSGGGYGISEYVFVLDKLEKSYLNRERTGRRSISKSSNDQAMFLTEQEVRSILLRFQDYGLTVISRGRGGTKITDLGRTALRILKEMN